MFITKHMCHEQRLRPSRYEIKIGLGKLQLEASSLTLSPKLMACIGENI
jgi:hypothetical protein